MEGVHGSALNTPVSSLGDPVRENAHTARWFRDCVLWLGEVFDDIMDKSLSAKFLRALRERAKRANIEMSFVHEGRWMILRLGVPA